jgi:hypothetical protein
MSGLNPGFDITPEPLEMNTETVLNKRVNPSAKP